VTATRRRPSTRLAEQPHLRGRYRERCVDAGEPGHPGALGQHGARRRSLLTHARAQPQDLPGRQPEHRPRVQRELGQVLGHQRDKAGVVRPR